MTLGHGVRDVVSRASQCNEVGVRIENHDPEMCLEQELLEDHAERVRLARAGLPAEKRMAIETACVERQAHTGSEPQLTDLERRASRSNALEPDLHLLGCRGAHEPVVERSSVAVEDHAGSPHCSNADARGDGRTGVVERGARELGTVDLDELELEDLPEPCRAVDVDRHIAARTKRQSMG